MTSKAVVELRAVSTCSSQRGVNVLASLSPGAKIAGPPVEICAREARAGGALLCCEFCHFMGCPETAITRVRRKLYCIQYSREPSRHRFLLAPMSSLVASSLDRRSVKTPFVDRVDCVLDTGAYMLNLASCARCGARQLKEAGRCTVETDLAGIGSYEENVRFQHVCSSCDYVVAVHDYSFTVDGCLQTCAKTPLQTVKR